MKRLLRAGMRQAWRRGILEGSRAWIVVGGVSLVGHLALKALKRNDEVIWSGELTPGQVLTVTHELPE